MKSEDRDENLVRTAGRGVVYITFAKLWFMMAGYVLIFGLPRIFTWAAGGDDARGVALFGAYKLVIMGVSFINNGIITGTIQSVSKFTSEDESQAQAVRKTALKVQGGLGVVIAIVYIGFADLMAQALGSPDLAHLMRLTAGIIVAYSCYAVFIGSFNGQRLFSKQALFDFSYITLKTALIIGLAAAGFEVLGTVVGFLVASVIIAVVAAILGGLGGQGSFPAGRYFRFAAILVIYTFLLNLVMSFDLFLLKGMTSHMAMQNGQSVEAASDFGKTLAGMYGAAQGLAFIPYQAIISIAFVAFPLISKVTHLGDEDKTKDYIRKTLRFSLLVIVGLASVFAAVPRQALSLIFPPVYAAASGALGWLAIGIAAFGMMVVANTILNGAGRPLRAMLVVTAALAAVCVGVVVSVHAAGPSSAALGASARGAAVGMIVGMGVGGVMVYRTFGAFWPWATFSRVLAASVTVVLVGRFALPDSGPLVTLLECGGILFFYFAILVLTGELGRDDWENLKNVAGKEKR